MGDSGRNLGLGVGSWDLPRRLPPIGEPLGKGCEEAMKLQQQRLEGLRDVVGWG